MICRNAHHSSIIFLKTSLLTTDTPPIPFTDDSDPASAPSEAVTAQPETTNSDVPLDVAVEPIAPAKSEPEPETVRPNTPEKNQPLDVLKMVEEMDAPGLPIAVQFTNAFSIKHGAPYMEACRPHGRAPDVLTAEYIQNYATKHPWFKPQDPLSAIPLPCPNPSSTTVNLLDRIQTSPKPFTPRELHSRIVPAIGDNTDNVIPGIDLRKLVWWNDEDGAEGPPFLDNPDRNIKVPPDTKTLPEPWLWAQICPHLVGAVPDSFFNKHYYPPGTPVDKMNARGEGITREDALRVLILAGMYCGGKVPVDLLREKIGLHEIAAGGINAQNQYLDLNRRKENGEISITGEEFERYFSMSNQELLKLQADVQGRIPVPMPLSIYVAASIVSSSQEAAELLTLANKALEHRYRQAAEMVLLPPVITAPKYRHFTGPIQEILHMINLQELMAHGRILGIVIADASDPTNPNFREELFINGIMAQGVIKFFSEDDQGGGGIVFGHTAASIGINPDQIEAIFGGNEGYPFFDPGAYPDYKPDLTTMVQAAILHELIHHVSNSQRDDILRYFGRKVEEANSDSKDDLFRNAEELFVEACEAEALALIFPQTLGRYYVSPLTSNQQKIVNSALRQLLVAYPEKREALEQMQNQAEISPLPKAEAAAQGDVLRTKIASLLGLTPEVDDETLLRMIARKFAPDTNQAEMNQTQDAGAIPAIPPEAAPIPQMDAAHNGLGLEESAFMHPLEPDTVDRLSSDPVQTFVEEPTIPDPQLIPTPLTQKPVAEASIPELLDSHTGRHVIEVLQERGIDEQTARTQVINIITLALPEDDAELARYNSLLARLREYDRIQDILTTAQRRDYGHEWAQMKEIIKGQRPLRDSDRQGMSHDELRYAIREIEDAWLDRSPSQ